MDFFWTVEADSHHEVVFLEELAPLRSQQRSVGLQRVCYRFSLYEGFLQFNHSLEEIYSQKGRLPALPDELNDRRWLRRDVVRDEGGKDIIGHPVLFSRAEENLLFEIKAILAIKITQRAYGLCNDMNALAGAHSARLLIVLSPVLFWACQHL
jgi:hypothetical protein